MILKPISRNLKIEQEEEEEAGQIHLSIILLKTQLKLF
jgi:hypothetical protein